MFGAGVDGGAGADEPSVNLTDVVSDVDAAVGDDEILGDKDGIVEAAGRIFQIGSDGDFAGGVDDVGDAVAEVAGGTDGSVAADVGVAVVGFVTECVDVGRITEGSVVFVGEVGIIGRRGDV